MIVVVLAVALGVVALVALFLSLRLAGARRIDRSPDVEAAQARAEQAERDAERSRAAATRVEEQLASVQQSADNLRRRAEVAERRATEADRRVDGADRRAESAEKRATDAETRLGGSEQRASEARQAAVDARSALEEAEGRLAVAESRAVEAESRAVEAESRAAAAEAVAAAVGRAEAVVAVPLEPAAPGDPAGAGRCLWELERVRAEREWADVVGPGIALPVRWDGTLRAAIGTELAVIREVIGTPSDLEAPGGGPVSDPLAGTVVARLSSELLRALGRAGDEMDVNVTDHEIVVRQPDDSPTADLDRLAVAARAAGAEITRDGSRTTLRLPG